MYQHDFDKSLRFFCPFLAPGRVRLESLTNPCDKISSISLITAAHFVTVSPADDNETFVLFVRINEKIFSYIRGCHPRRSAPRRNQLSYFPDWKFSLNRTFFRFPTPGPITFPAVCKLAGPERGKLNRLLSGSSLSSGRAPGKETSKFPRLKRTPVLINPLPRP